MTARQETFEFATDAAGPSFAPPDGSAFPWPSENDLVPVEQWSVKTKTKSALENAQCPCCGARPETLDPLPPGWCWDTMEPVNQWVWCPKWTKALADAQNDN